MFKYNLLFILTFVCAKTLSLDIPHGLNITSGEFDENTTLEDVFGGAAETVLEDILDIDANSTASTGLGEETEESKKCAGGLLDFIQCVVHTKLEHFRKEFSKVSFPDKPPRAFQRQAIDSKIEGSLEKWIQEYSKQLAIADGNCTTDE